MKFLTISKVKDVFYALPQTERNKMLLAAVKSLLVYKKKMGDKWHMYNSPGGMELITIGEYNSVEEYSQSLQSPDTFVGYMSHKSIPLIEYDVKELEAYLKQMKAAK